MSNEQISVEISIEHGKMSQLISISCGRTSPETSIAAEILGFLVEISPNMNQCLGKTSSQSEDFLANMV